jgi:hypothetical protein
MAQGMARVFIVTAQQVHKKHVFPGTPAHGPRLDLAQTDVAQREHAERLEQRPGTFFRLNASDVLSAWIARRPRLAALDLSLFDLSSFDERRSG